ncbi:MAG: peptidoglycan-binding protein [Acidobacteriota bacterium]|nr:peptidoglycan-binding protein [Acidobacteriota bacterium]
MAKTLDAGTTGHPGVVDNTNPTSLYDIARQDLTSQTQVAATLGYTGNYTVVNQVGGIVTSLPSVGRVVTQGQVLYAVNGEPVVLLSGSTPAYRTLSQGMSGADVAELNADLVALKYASSRELDPTSNYFGAATTVALKGLQSALGVTQNGMLALGQAVFEPTAVRVTSVSATLGAAATPNQPLLVATSTKRQVSIALDASQQSEVAVGDRVAIILPNNRTTVGVISSVGSIATAPPQGGSNTSPTITVLVNPTDASATGTWDQAPVNVTITTATVHGVLVVPVDALLAQSSNGYAVEVVGVNGIHHLVPVTLGLFDDADGMVQVSGTGLAVGQRVVVPKL